MLSQHTLPPLVIRADAHTLIGSGHVMRCFALGEAWQAQGGMVTFLSYCPNQMLSQRIAARGWRFLPVEQAYPEPVDLDTTLQLLEELTNTHGQPPWIVLDGYHFDSTYQQMLRTAGYRVLIIDDEAHLPVYHADVLLNQNMHAEWLSYCTDPDTLLLLGNRYVLLRLEFLAWRSQQRAIPPVARKVLVTLGGGDPHNITFQIIRVLQQVAVENLEVRVVVGTYNPHYEILQKAVANAPMAIHLIKNADNMPAVMAWADLAIAAGGMTGWELAFMGVPSALFQLAPNQQRNVEGLAEVGAAVHLGDALQITETHLQHMLTELCYDQHRRQALSQQSQQWIDGKGGTRVVAVMTGLGDRAFLESQVECRLAALQDALPVWRLANDPGVRDYSFHSEPIPFAHHLEWFRKKLSSTENRFWIVELTGTMVAQIRYERTDRDTLAVHFSVVPSFRGKGLGTKALNMTWEQTCKALGAKRVRGIVFRRNIPSIRAFTKAGFQQVGETVERGEPCYVFEQCCS